MILIDTSAWIEFLRKKGQKKIKDKVSLLIELDKAAITGPIRFELLSGADRRSEADLRSIFSLCKTIPFTEECWEKAASIEQTLRVKGFRIPRDDIFTATVAILNKMPLLHTDKHFEMVRKSGIPLTQFDV